MKTSGPSRMRSKSACSRGAARSPSSARASGTRPAAPVRPVGPLAAGFPLRGPDVATAIRVAQGGPDSLADGVLHGQPLRADAQVGRQRPQHQAAALRRRRSTATISSSRSARPAPARPTSPWRWPPRRCSRRQVKRIVLARPAVEAGEKLGFLPGDLVEKINPYLRPLYDALYDIIGFEKVERAAGARHHRDRADRLHARPHAQRRVHHPRRGAEHDDRADEDVPDPHRLRLQGRGHRRHHADRPAPGQDLGPARGAAGPRRHREASGSCSSTSATSCATRSCSRSSPPTRRSTASARRPPRGRVGAASGRRMRELPGETAVRRPPPADLPAEARDRPKRRPRGAMRCIHPSVPRRRAAGRQRLSRWLWAAAYVLVTTLCFSPTLVLPGREPRPGTSRRATSSRRAT